MHCVDQAQNFWWLNQVVHIAVSGVSNLLYYSGKYKHHLIEH